MTKTTLTYISNTQNLKYCSPATTITYQTITMLHTQTHTHTHTHYHYLHTWMGWSAPSLTLLDGRDNKIGVKTCSAHRPLADNVTEDTCSTCAACWRLPTTRPVLVSTSFTSAWPWTPPWHATIPALLDTATLFTAPLMISLACRTSASRLLRFHTWEQTVWL